MKQEIELLKACQGCPYIITLHEVFYDSVSIIEIFILIMKYMYEKFFFTWQYI